MEQPSPNQLSHLHGTDANSQQNLPQHSTTTSNMEQPSPNQLSHLQSLPHGVLSIMLQQLPVEPQLWRAAHSTCTELYEAMRTQREVLRGQICCRYQKYNLATYNVRYKEDNPWFQRLAESSRVRTKHKGKVPIICERDINASGNCPTCSKQKFLAEETLTCGKFILAVQKQLTHAAKLYFRVAHSEGSFVYPSLFTMGEMDRELGDQDGYLYVVYSDIPPEPAQPELLLERSIVSSGQLLVRFARLGDNTEAFRLIVAGVPLDCEDALGMTAVFWSAASGNAALVDALIDAGAELDVRSKAGHTALMSACSEGHIEIAKALINAGAHQETTKDTSASEDTSTNTLSNWALPNWVHGAREALLDGVVMLIWPSDLE